MGPLFPALHRRCVVLLSGRRQCAYPPDERCDFDIRTPFVTQEPAPEFVVFSIQKPQENFALVGRALPPCAVQPAAQQLVQFAHTAPATPAEFFQFVVIAHGFTSTRTTSRPPLRE